MRYAILSDIHGNLEALRAVLGDADGRADAVLCLGDVVGYGADPEGCVEAIAERCLVVVAGNHDHAVAGRLDLDWFNPAARAAIEWTAACMGDRHRCWLGALPLVRRVEEATLVHASPARPEAWDYLLSAADGHAAFRALATPLCFVGHSHLPAVWEQGPTGRRFEPGPTAVAIAPGCRYIVNAGSVGQPRDRDPRAAWALWDSAAGRVTIRRVAYDVAAARRKIEDAGLPRFLADRLAVGR